MPVHNFAQASQFDDAHNSLSAHTAELQPIAQAFIRNMNRVRGMGMLPINLISIAMINEAARLEALVNLKLPFHDPKITYGDPAFESELFAKVDAERKRLMDKWMQSEGREKFSQRTLQAGIFGMNIILDSSDADGWEAVQATMAAMLIGLWTAFESLAQDTWIIAVNKCPDPLATRVLDPKAQKADQLKTVSWQTFVNAGYDLKNMMGTVLLRERKVDFQTLGNLRDAYKVAFNSEFEALFEEHNSALSRIEAVRNLFAHKGGVIDEKFVKRMGNSQLTPNQILGLTGEYIASTGNAVSKFSTQLFQAVDKWLADNAAKTA